MENFNFEDTQTAGIWWSTHLAIKDACIELKKETQCDDEEIINLLKSISDYIKREGF